jgi:hypothetical protein
VDQLVERVLLKNLPRLLRVGLYLFGRDLSVDRPGVGVWHRIRDPVQIRLGRMGTDWIEAYDGIRRGTSEPLYLRGPGRDQRGQPAP